jgi:hypothetical protein
MLYSGLRVSITYCSKARTDFTLPTNHKVVVTFPWLLGLIEGDGWFSFNKLVPRLSLQLNYRQEYVLKAILEFFGGLGNLNIGKPRQRVDSFSSQPMAILEFNQIAFLRNVILPGFKALTFLSKKGKEGCLKTSSLNYLSYQTYILYYLI